MKPRDPITEVTQVLLREKQQARHKAIYRAARAKPGRVPIDGVDAHKVAWRIMDRIEWEQAKVKGHKLHKLQVEAIKHRLNRGEEHKSIARDYPVHYTMMSKIKTGKVWNHVQPTKEIA